MEQMPAANTSLLLLLSTTLGSHHLLKPSTFCQGTFPSCFLHSSATAGLSPGSGRGKEGLPALTTGEGG